MFWLFVVAVVLDVVFILAWRRRRGVSGRLEATLAAIPTLPRKIVVWWDERGQHSVFFAWLNHLPAFPLNGVGPQVDRRLIWGFALPVLLAGIPAALVIRDRWLFKGNDNWLVRQFICSVDVFCPIQLPSYFAFIVPLVIALFFLAWWLRSRAPSLEALALDERPFKKPETHIQSSRLQKIAALVLISGAIFGLLVSALSAFLLRDTWPGMEYAAFYLLLLLGVAVWGMSVKNVTSWLQRDALRTVSMIAAHLALIWLLVTINDQYRSPWLALLATILTMLNVLRYRKVVSPIFWVVSLALIVYSVQVNAWWFAIVGDDYAFLFDAQAALREFAQLGNERFFLGAYTHGSHAFFTAHYQALFFVLFGEHNYAWRFSSIYPAVMALPLFYAFFNYFLRHRVALLLTVLLAGSHYLMTFSKIGYNNLQAFFVLALMLYLAARAAHTGRLHSYVWLGTAIGFSFYLFPGALLAVPLPFLLLLIYAPPRNRDLLKRWGAMVLTGLVLIYPLFLQPRYWQTKLGGTFMTGHGTVITPDNNAIWHLFSNLLYTLSSPIFIIEESHYVVVAYLDVISAALMLLGVSYLVWRWRGQRFITFLLLSFVLMVPAVGIIHNYQRPPATRMFMLLPWFVFFAVVGLMWLGVQLQRSGFSTMAAGRIIIGLITLVLVFNIYQAYVLSYQRSDRYHDFVTMLVGVGQEFYRDPQMQQHSIVMLNDASSLHVPTMQNTLDIYQLPANDTTFVEVRVHHWPGSEDVLIFDEAARLLDDAEDLVVVNPSLVSLAPETLALYDELFRSQGRSFCDLYTFTGDLRFRMWYGSQRPDFCDQYSLSSPPSQ